MGCADMGCAGGGACGVCDHWYLGVEATFLHSIFDGRGAINLASNNLTSSTTTWIASDAADVEYLTMAARIWFGYQCHNGWGVAVRYWRMEASATTGDIFNPILIPGDVSGFQASDVHKLYTTDLELTRDFCCGNWQMMGTIGARYAEARRSVALSSDSLAGTDYLTASGLAEQSTDGLGVTFSWAAVRPVSCCGCCVDYFCKLRGSVLWGDSTSSALTSAMIVGPGGSAFSYNGALADGTGSTWIGELQTGLMWSRCVSTWNARLFASIALEYQYWDVDGGGNANAYSYAGGSPGVSTIAIASSSPNLSTHLVGFTIGTGFMW